MDPWRERLINSSGWADYKDTSGYNPLFLAVHNGKANLVPSLVKKYSPTEIVQGKTLMNIAAARGHEEIVRLLSEKDTNGNTPLHLAIEGNQSSAFRLLLNQCNVNVKNCRDETPLHYAAGNNRVEFAKILVKNGANVNARDCNLKTPLYYALEAKYVQLAEILFKNGAVLNKEDYEREDPLHSAAITENWEMVKLIMKNGWNIIDVSPLCHTPLEIAVSVDNLELVDYMMKNGSKQNETITEDELGLLIKCVYEGKIHILKFLIDTGVKSKINLLDTSIRCRQFKIWKYLITCRSKIVAETYFSETKLHWAIRAGQLETVKILVNVQENTVETDSLACKFAVYIAVESRNENILQVLLNAGYSTERCFGDIGPVHLAATCEHTRLMKILLKAGADINSETKDRITPLHFAATAGRSNMVRFLLQNGADPIKPCEDYGSSLSFVLRMFSSRVERSPITPAMFANLLRITKMLILHEAKGKFYGFMLHATKINVIGKDTKISEFRPEIVRCILNHLSDDEVKHCSQLPLEQGNNIDHSNELLHLLMEYNDSKSCSEIELWKYYWEADYKCYLLLIDYSRNVDDLMNVRIDTSSTSVKREEKEAKVDNTVILKLIIARLVLLTNSRDSRVSTFCRKHKLLDWRKQCEQQKVSMQKTQIADYSNVTFYDILTESVDKVANYVKNENFCKIVESSCAKFSAYTDFLKLRIEKGIRRKALQDECTNLVHNLIKRKHQIWFSNVSIDQIFRYLSVVDLRRLSEAFL